MASTTPAAVTATTPANTEDEPPKPRSWKGFGAFLGLLALDVTGTAILLTAWIPRISKWEEATSKYHIPSSVIDLAILTAARLLFSLLALAISYGQGNVRPEYTFDMHHKNGVKKSRSELEEEALEQSFVAWLGRYIVRPAFPCEFVALVTGLLCITKSLLRLDLEIGRLADAEPVHPLMWIAISFAAIVSTLEMFYVDSVCVMLGKWGNEDRQTERPTFLRHLSSTLSLPLLANDTLHQDEEEAPAETNGDGVDTPATEEDPTGVSEIGKDTNYKASWKDLLAICTPDLHLLVVAFVFLILAAAAQVYIPRYTGKILNGLVETFSGDDDDGGHKSISDVPGFKTNVRKLIVWSVLSGVFSGIRGSVFSVVGGRVNVRLRRRLMDALLVQDIGFFDTTKTGDITSRLSSDTTLVGDQVTYNVNIFLRSLVQAIGVLIFMFAISWQLSILAFISVPAITVLSKWYGQFLRSLSKVMQTKLAEGNAISEAAMSSMPTVRAFDAATTEFDEFDKSMKKYLALNTKSAVAYAGYATCSTSLPQLVTALVVFYGGLMVRNGDLESGDLVSFLLYLQSLSDAFSYIGYIFSSLTQAVGAADKVFELMNRKPQLRSPDTSNQAAATATTTGTTLDPSTPTTTALWHTPKHQTTTVRVTGLEPPTCRGDILIKDVEMYYPSRPQRRVLNGLSLHIPPGKIAALVGQSGGGKSSVISLVQHLYEPSSGVVQLDGINVHDLSPRWLSQHISIVSQEPTLFARSIKRNIMYGLEGTDMEPSQEEIERVAKLANADSFIESMPQKYETEVGERGVQLSGGQKQRIAIARALVRKPKVLLLDEATSALDAESEAMVQEAIDHMLQAGRDDPTRENAGMTVMVVAHRLSTIRNADIIFVFQDGKVVEQGHHTELIQNENGPYASLIRRQMNIQQKLEAGKS